MKDYQAPAHLLKDRVILITGAGDGIGAAAAKTCAAHGATVILLGRTLVKLEAIYDAIEAVGHPQPAIVPMDLSTAGLPEYTQLSETIEKEFGRLDGILHNAGLLGDITPLEMYDPDTWDFVMRVNLRAPYLLTQSMLPLLKLSEDASVIFTSSSVGRRTRAFWGAYAISKCGLEGLSTLWSDELKNISNIRMNCINPGATRTRMRADAYPAENPNTLKTPEDIMPAYLWLLGPDSKGQTGLSIDAQ